MSENDTFLAIFLASKTSARMTAWNALSEEARHTKMQEGIAAWKAWVEKHHAAIVGMGGPLGKTKKVSEHGIEDISNLMSAYTGDRAGSHDAAAKLCTSRSFLETPWRSCRFCRYPAPRRGRSMSASGTKRTSQSRSAMSAFGGKADIPQSLLLTQSGHERLRIAAAQTGPMPPIPRAGGVHQWERMGTPRPSVAGLGSTVIE